MSNTFGKNIRLTTFGESHGPAIGGILDGFPSNVAIDPEKIQEELNRRRPGQSKITTDRNEKDQIEILSGIFEGKTTGTPIGFMIRNEDKRSADYDHLKDVYRMGHADKVYAEKYGHRDHRGGGRASARETANWVAGGAFARQWLDLKNIKVSAFVSRVHDITIEANPQPLDLTATYDSIVRCPDPVASKKMEAFITEVKEKGDTVGGAITCMIEGVPAGVGEPVFQKLHAALGQAMLSINTAKSFEMGIGKQASYMYGSEYNVDAGLHGGITGGISTGEKIWFTTTFKPVSTLMKSFQAVDESGNLVEMEGKGRHDPCVLPRAVPIVEAMSCLVIADFLLQK